MYQDKCDELVRYLQRCHRERLRDAQLMLTEHLTISTKSSDLAKRHSFSRSKLNFEPELLQKLYNVFMSDALSGREAERLFRDSCLVPNRMTEGTRKKYESLHQLFYKTTKYWSCDFTRMVCKHRRLFMDVGFRYKKTNEYFFLGFAMKSPAICAFVRLDLQTRCIDTTTDADHHLLEFKVNYADWLDEKAFGVLECGSLYALRVASSGLRPCIATKSL